MKATMFRVSTAIVVVLLGWRLSAQEMVPSPDPIGGAKVGVDAGTRDLLVNVPAADRWRYRWHDGHWWYWAPQDRWMWYSSDGQWIEFSAPPNSPGGYRGNGYSLPAPAYVPVHPPGVAVGVHPYAGVNVGVGRRIGVDVCGPHGSVRVGRIFVGW